MCSCVFHHKNCIRAWFVSWKNLAFPSLRRLEIMWKKDDFHLFKHHVLPCRLFPKMPTNNSSHVCPSSEREDLLSLPLNLDWPFDQLRPTDTVAA